MGKMKRLRKRLQMKPSKPPAWAGEPNERELELDRELEAIERKYQTVGLTEAEKIEGVKLHIELLKESQRRSGITLIEITPTDDGAIYNASNFYRVLRDVQMLMDAGMPLENASARALEDEHYRQKREVAEAAEAEAGQSRGLIGAVKNIFGLKGA